MPTETALQTFTDDMLEALRKLYPDQEFVTDCVVIVESIGSDGKPYLTVQGHQASTLWKQRGMLQWAIDADIVNIGEECRDEEEG